MLLAIKVREDNLEYIMSYAKERGLNLDYIGDNAECNAMDGHDTYILVAGSVEKNNLTITDWIEPDFRNHLKFVEEEDPTRFVQVEKI